MSVLATLPISNVMFGQQLVFHGITQSTSFPAYVAPDYAQVFAQARESHPYQTVITMYDRAVPNVGRFVSDISGLIDVPTVTVPLDAGEQLKTLERVTALTQDLGQRGIGQKSLMLVVGGGTLCNAAGFIAAMWKGMRQVVIPTNFTAIGDVAIGSVHIVNLGEKKNGLQLYSDPLAVVFDPSFISTLPRTERRNGLAETVKHAIAQDSELFLQLERHVADGTLFDDIPLFDFALRTAQLKDELMGVDPFGELAQHTFLYGHVLAHAIEPASGYTIPHGEAVALGLLGELAFFHGSTAPIILRVRALLKALGLPIRLPRSLSIERIIEHLSHVMTADGFLLIPRVEQLGALSRVDERYTGKFDHAAIEHALRVIAS